MSFLSQLQNKVQTLSYEFFPPKTVNSLERFYHVISEVSKYNPNFISITYGAGGSTQNNTLDLVQQISQKYNFDCIPHLTGISHTTQEINNILNFYKENNLKYILALRGDIPKDEDHSSISSNFFYATNLISHIQNQNQNFNLGCACYPEVHTEALSMVSDLDYFKKKQDLGVKFAITQLFFHNEGFFEFRERAIQAGITIPIIAGIMPVTNIEQLQKFASFGTKINANLKQTLLNASDVESAGIEWITKQCIELLRNNVSGLHFYTLNRFEPSVKITQNIKLQGFF